MLIKYKCKDKFGITGIVEVEGELFVTKDENGKDVFAKDKVNYKGNEAIVKQNDGDFGYHLEFVNLSVMEPIKTGKKVTNILYREMCEDIELIEDKEDD